MAERTPLKLTDLGGGSGQIDEMTSSDTLPVANLSVMVAASAGTDGTKGVVPAALAGEQDDILHGDGTWRAGYVHPNHTGDVTSSADGAQAIVNKKTLTGSGGVTVSNTPSVIAGAAPDISLTYGSTANTVCQGNDARLSDARTPTSHNQDASTITSGVLDLARIPTSAVERLSIVVDEAARFDLTTASVQNGDSVKQLDTGAMYVVVDSMNLANASGYEEYTAGSAAAVPWTGVTGKPTAFAPAAHTQSAATITDFASSVSSNTAVAANTAKETNATHTGDVTGSVELTIVANKVTTGKMQQVATASILGRNTGGTGNIEVMTAANARNVLNVANGATANDTDANLKNRANHTGTEPVTAGGTGLTAIAAKSMLVADTANTLTALVVPAGKSIRRNVTDTAFETFTGGSGDMVLATPQTIPTTGKKTYETGAFEAADPVFTGNVGITTGDLVVGADKFFVDQSTGFVGIGTDTPEGPLHVKMGADVVVLTPNTMNNSDTLGDITTYSPSADPSYPVWRLFDGELNAQCQMQRSGITLPQYVSIDFGSEKRVTSYRIYAAPTTITEMPTTWVLLGSNSGTMPTTSPFTFDSTWSEVHTVTGESGWTSGEWISYVCSTPGVYQYYALRVTGGMQTKYFAIGEMEMSGTEGVDFIIANSQGIGVGMTPTAQIQISGSIAYKASGTLWANPSDARLKDVAGLADLNQCWMDISDIPTKRYTVRTDCFNSVQVFDRSQTGWVAQDVQVVMEKAVTVKPFTKLDGTVIEDCLHLDASQLFPTLFGAFQLAQQRIVALEDQVTDLLARVAALEP